MPKVDGVVVNPEKEYDAKYEGYNAMSGHIRKGDLHVDVVHPPPEAKKALKELTEQQ